LILVYTLFVVIIIIVFNIGIAVAIQDIVLV